MVASQLVRSIVQDSNQVAQGDKRGMDGFLPTEHGWPAPIREARANGLLSATTRHKPVPVDNAVSAPKKGLPLPVLDPQWDHITSLCAHAGLTGVLQGNLLGAAEHTRDSRGHPTILKP
jgi:hypothetical protein